MLYSVIAPALNRLTIHGRHLSFSAKRLPHITDVVTGPRRVSYQL